MTITLELRDLAARQDGVVARGQLTAAGLAHHDIRRLVRQRLLVPTVHGVYVTHTGPRTWQQLAWTAVLAHAPAVLDGLSALRAAGMDVTVPDGVVHVAVEANRRLKPARGVFVRRVRDLEPQALWATSPPRLRVEPALLHAASQVDDDLRAVGLLTDAVGDRLTSPARLGSALAQRQRIRRRDVITDVVEGLASGTNSVLEHAYLRRVETPHGLPRGTRQLKLPGEKWPRDIVHEAERVVIELDGRTHHSSSRDRTRDLERDASAAAAGFLSLRFGWGQVVGMPCETARRVVGVLQQCGWPGWPTSCARCP